MHCVLTQDRGVALALMGGYVKSGEKVKKKVNNGKCEITQRLRKVGGEREKERIRKSGAAAPYHALTRASAFSRFIPR